MKLDIPVPRINVVQSYARDVSANYRVPLSFIRYHRLTADEWIATLEYVADAEDEGWLQHNAKFGGAIGILKSDGAGDSEAAGGGSSTHSKVQPKLSLNLLEHMLDLLEKATAFEAIITAYQADILFQAKIPQLYHIFPIKERQGVATVKQVIQDVYNYWVEKRCKLKRPLLRRFWPVTSSDDTNPHMVFRPREKEKYKLRKKRQNDANAYRKMKQLRDDFDNLRAVLDLVRRREEIHRAHVKLQVDLFEQRLYDVIDTSGRARPSKRIRKEEMAPLLDVPSYFDVHLGGRKAKRARKTGQNGFPIQPLAGSSAPFYADTKDRSGRTPGTTAGAAAVNVAGRNNGEPAPNFLHPLPTRESYVTSWEGAVPHVPTYEDSHAQPTYRFRHRPRVGRGGRICIDRLPQPAPLHSGLMPVTVYTAGYAMERSLEPKERLLELLPKPLDHAALSRRIEAISVAAIKEDFDARKLSGMAGGDAEENDGDVVMVKLEDWLETDDQLWGEERYAVGPI